MYAQHAGDGRKLAPDICDPHVSCQARGGVPEGGRFHETLVSVAEPVFSRQGHQYMRGGSSRERSGVQDTELECEKEEAVDSCVLRDPVARTEAEVERHDVGHMPCRLWCVEGEARDKHHHRL